MKDLKDCTPFPQLTRNERRNIMNWFVRLRNRRSPDQVKRSYETYQRFGVLKEYKGE